MAGSNFPRERTTDSPNAQNKETQPNSSSKRGINDRCPSLRKNQPPFKRTKTLANRSSSRPLKASMDSVEELDSGSIPPSRIPASSKMPLATKSSPPVPKTPASDSVLPKESDIVKGDAAFSLLQQWAIRGFFVPKGLGATSKFPNDLSMGLLHGEMVHRGLWVELVNTTSEIAGATLNVEGKQLIVYQTTLAGLRKYCFNTRIVEVALGHLMIRRRAECIRLRPSIEATAWSESDLETLEQDLEALRSQLSSLQFEIEQKELEMGQCQAARDFADDAHRKQEQIDMLEEALSHVE